jgi:hypothetical protein
MKAFAPLALLLAGLLTLPAHAGLELAESDGHTTFLSDGRVKTVPPEEEAPIHILDTQLGTVTFVIPARETYAQGTPEAFCQAVTAMQEKALSGLSQQERQMLEKYKEMQGDEAAPEVRIEHRGSGGDILGYPTQHYAVYVNGSLYEEVWISDAPELMAEVGDREALANLSARMAACVTSGPGMATDPESTPPYLELMNKGLALKSVDHTSGDGETVQVRRLQVRALGDSTFQPPEGYRQVTLERALQLGME